MNTAKNRNKRTEHRRQGRARPSLRSLRSRSSTRSPRYVHSPELKPYGSCFVCVVEVAGRPGPWFPACATKIAEGMKVKHQQTIACAKARKDRVSSCFLSKPLRRLCVLPACRAAPAGVDAQGYIALAAMGEYRKAVDLVRQANPLPAVCGRICVRKCEVVCRRQDVEEPVAINYIKTLL